jgi:hypothetical protein
VRILVTFRTDDLVLLADRSVDVAQETERKVLSLRECEVLLWSVERRTKDDRTALFEPLGTVTQALSLLGSTRGRGFRIPPQQHPLTAEIRKPHGLTVLIRKLEVGGH